MRKRYIVNLFVIQCRSRIAYCEETTHLQLISRLFDTAQDVLIQFTDFLVGSSRDVTPVAKLMPSFASLLSER